MASSLMVDGWEIGFPKDVLVASLERGNTATDCDFNVSFAYDAAEAAIFVRQDLDDILDNWNGSDQDLAFILAFARRF